MINRPGLSTDGERKVGVSRCCKKALMVSFPRPKARNRSLFFFPPAGQESRPLFSSLLLRRKTKTNEEEEAMEKGGKGYSAPSAKPPKATSFTPTASSTGLEDAPVKSKKRGRKPKINTEVRSDATVCPSQLFGGKGDTFFSKGMPGKGISGEKTASAPKAPAPKEPIPLELKVESELPNNAKCLMDCEAAQILEGVQEQMVVLSEDPEIKIPVSFDRGLQYSKTSNNYSDPSEVRRVLETLTKHGVSEGEMCVIANVCPDTTEEVFALVPSLKGKKNTLTGPLISVLSDVAKLRPIV